jgi:uncharacterized membrane protein YjjP (DUF1212 family)
VADRKAMLGEALDALLRFAALMLAAGDTAFRVRESTNLVAARLGVERLALHVALDSLTATARRDGEQLTASRDVAAPGINAGRIAALERLARSSVPDLTPAALAASLDTIEAAPSSHSIVTVAVAIGLASGCFSFLNGGDSLATLAASAAGGLGQAARALMFRRRLNQYAVTVLAAAFASGVYCLLVSAVSATFGAAKAVGFISSVLFLVPGFPLVASLLDLLQHQTVAGVARLFYGTLLLLAAAFGLSLVAAIAGLSPAPAVATTHGVDLLTVLWRAVASFVGGCGFAILYNGTSRTVLAVGVLSLLGNDLRLSLHDLGLALPPATFLGALAVGLLASLVREDLNDPRIALTVPGIIIMTPGLYAFQTIVFLNQGDVLVAIRAGAACMFIVGAMAMGLAAARFMSERRWMVER